MQFRAVFGPLLNRRAKYQQSQQCVWCLACYRAAVRVEITVMWIESKQDLVMQTATMLIT